MLTTMVLDSTESQSYGKKLTDAGTIGTKLVPDIFWKNRFFNSFNWTIFVLLGEPSVHINNTYNALNLKNYQIMYKVTRFFDYSENKLLCIFLKTTASSLSIIIARGLVRGKTSTHLPPTLESTVSTGLCLDVPPSTHRYLINVIEHRFLCHCITFSCFWILRQSYAAHVFLSTYVPNEHVINSFVY